MPIYRFQTDLDSTPEEAARRLAAVTREVRGLGGSLRETFGVKPAAAVAFKGRVEDGRFCVRRDYRFRNSFMPEIRGRIVRAPGAGAERSRVRVTMHLPGGVALFTLLWLGLVGAAGLNGFRQAMAGDAAGTAAGGGAGASMGWLMAGLMFVFGVVLTAGSFYLEAIEARGILEAALRGEAASAAAEKASDPSLLD